MTRKFFIVTALVAGFATTAEAQICAGTTPFTAGHMRVGLAAEFPEGANVYGGEFAWGNQNGSFLGASLTHMSFDGIDPTALRFGGNAGYEMRFESMPKLRLCPVASLGYTNGPNEDPVSTNMIDYALGAAVGSVLPAGENIAIVPSAGLAWTGARIKVSDGTNDISASDSWLQARLAAGIVINRTFTIAPVYTIPFEDGAESTFGFAASYNFGRSGAVMQQGSKKGRKR